MHALRWAGLVRVSRPEAEALARLTHLLGQALGWGRLEAVEEGTAPLQFRLGSIRVSSPEEVRARIAGLVTTWRLENSSGQHLLLGADLYLDALLAATAAGQPPPAVVPRGISQAEALVATAALAGIIQRATGGAWHVVEAKRAPQVCEPPGAASALIDFGVGVAGGWGKAVAVFELGRLLHFGASAAGGLSSQARKRLVGMEVEASLRSRVFALDPEDLRGLESGALVVFGAGLPAEDFILESGGQAWSVEPTARGNSGVWGFRVTGIASSGGRGQGATMEDEFGPGSEGSMGMQTDFSDSVSGAAEETRDPPSDTALDQDRISGLTLDASVELGRMRLAVSDVLGLTVGSVLELDRAIDETADLRVGGKLVARGRLVDVEGKLGIQITELLE